MLTKKTEQEVSEERFGRILCRERHADGLTQSDVAGCSGWHESRISKLERGMLPLVIGRVPELGTYAVRAQALHALGQLTLEDQMRVLMRAFGDMTAKMPTAKRKMICEDLREVLAEIAIGLDLEIPGEESGAYEIARIPSIVPTRSSQSGLHRKQTA